MSDETCADAPLPGGLDVAPPYRGAGTRGVVPQPGSTAPRASRARRVTAAGQVWTAWAVTRCAIALGLIVAHSGARRPLLPFDVAVVYFRAAQHLAHGEVPYLNFPYEYPPATIPLLRTTLLFSGGSPAGFVIAWCLSMLVCDGLITHRLLRFPHGRSAALAWTIGLCLVGPTAFFRNDLVVVACFVVAFAATAERGTVLGGGLWMLGALAKVWPAAPLAGLVVLRRPGRRALAVGAAAVLVPAALGFLAVGGLSSMVACLLGRQGRRPIEIESLWATPAWLHGLARGAPPGVVRSFGSENLAGSAQLGALATWATLAVQALCVAAPVLLTRRAGGRRPTAPTLAWSLAVYLSATLVVAPVMSPQYVIWLLGAACVLLGTVGVGPSRAFVTTSLVVCLLTQAVFPSLFQGLQQGAPIAVTVLAARNAALLAMLAQAIAGLRRCHARRPARRTDRTRAARSAVRAARATAVPAHGSDRLAPVLCTPGGCAFRIAGFC